ncbi:MAG: hypothetical protein JW749_02055 [Sedimentisphaerales bacterium]|nr:hypothetical protein [Sedimentisphaerales bacterium]
MFTIDLLKGQGIPVRTKPQGVAIFVATFAVPALVAIVMTGYYFQTNVIISVAKQNIVSYENQTKQLSDALQRRQSFEMDKSSINACLADVSNLLRGHFQWTPVLVDLVQNLPDSVIITNLEVKNITTKRRISKNEKNRKDDANISVRNLKMRVAASPSAADDLEVRVFRDKLLASDVLGSKLDDIVIASQVRDTLDGRDVVCYDIDCIFKPGL